MRDFKRLQQDPPQGVNGSPNPDNIMQWNAVIFGPDDTPWDGGDGRSASSVRLQMGTCYSSLTLRAYAGTFKLTLVFTEDYPNKAPVVKFKSHMFHPNST